MTVTVPLSSTGLCTEWTSIMPELVTLEQFPKKVVWLSGAPGAGKGTNERRIINYAKLYRESLVASSLLNTPEMLEKINRGLLLDDKTVISAVLKGLQNPFYHQGVLVDGFPRTPGQAESVAWIYDQLQQARYNPLFAVFVLMIDEEESLKRQRYRAQMALEHNERVRTTGQGQLMEVRTTDLYADIALERYRQFIEITYAGLESLKGRIPFYRIDACGSFEEVQQRVLKALQSCFG